jgi:hypothetical protein
MSTYINRNLPGDVYDAAVNSNTPSITNTFATQLDLANINNPGNSNLLLSGNATWSETGMIFDTTLLSYQIAGVVYSANPQTITLPVSNPTNPRFDALVVDITSTVSVISGTPASNPLTPAIDENYVLIQYVLVGAAAVTPTITNEFVYREGSSPDWNVSATVGTTPVLVANFSSTTPSPFQGTECTLVNAPNYSTAKSIRYTKPASNISRSTFSFLTFRVYLPAAIPLRNVVVRLYNNATLIGTVNATAWGLNMSSAATWQLVSIPTNSFGNLGITTITAIQFLFSGNAANTFSTGYDRFAFDDIKFQSGYGPQTNTATIDIQNNGTSIASTSKLNFSSGNGTTWGVTYDTVNNKINIQSNQINANVTPQLNTIGRGLITADAGKFLMVDSASPETMTIPTNSVASIPIGSVIKIAQQGTGAVTITGIVGVIIRSSASLIAIGQYRVATLTKTDTNIWYVEYSV